MQYENIYNKLIARADGRKKSKTVYYERHHIYPKCLGGSNRKENIVLLTAREHFIAHKLLFKYKTGTDKVKMGFALHRMLFPNNKTQLSRKITSRIYSELKTIYNFLSGNNHPSFGRTHTTETKQRLSLERQGDKNPRFGEKPWNIGLTKNIDSRLDMTDLTRCKMSESATGRKNSEASKKKVSDFQKGRIKSEEHRRKIANTLRGRKMPQAQRIKMSISRKNKSQKIIKCPHCLKEGGTAMFRWHFDNCKLK